MKIELLKKGVDFQKLCGRLPENTVVGDLGADDAPDHPPAVHSHSKLQSGTRLMLHDAQWRCGYYVSSVLTFVVFL